MTALFFAVTDPCCAETDGMLWMLLPTILNGANNYRPEYEHEVPSFDDEHLRNYLPSVIASEKKSRLYPMAAIAPRNNSRMQAQQAVFTISHRENIPLEDAGIDPARRHVWRYRISSACKQAIARELQLLGYSRFQLFPELENVPAHT